MEDLFEGEVRSKFARDRRGHLQQSSVAFDGEERIGVHRAITADSPEIVSQQVDNHDVFAAVLLVSLKARHLPLVFREVETARHGAFHGTGDDVAVANPEKELWRQGEDVVAEDAQQGAIGDWLRP